MKGILEICIESKVGVGKGREGGAKPSNPVISILSTQSKEMPLHARRWKVPAWGCGGGKLEAMRVPDK